MTKDEILNSIEILKGLPNVKSVLTAEVEGHWVPFIGVEIVNGEHVMLESLDEVYVFALEQGIDKKSKH